MGTESLDTQAQRAHIRLLAPKLSRKPIADSGPPCTILQLHGKSLIKEDLLSEPHRKQALCVHSLSGYKLWWRSIVVWEQWSWMWILSQC